MEVTHRNIDEELLPGAWVTQRQLHQQKNPPQERQRLLKTAPRGSLSGFQKAWLAADSPFPSHCYYLLTLGRRLVDLVSFRSLLRSMSLICLPSLKEPPTSPQKGMFQFGRHSYKTYVPEYSGSAVCYDCKK